MLAVAVDLDGDVEAVVARVLVAGLDCPADADVVRKARDESAGALGLGLGAVRRPIVDDEDLEAGSTARISPITRAIVGASFRAGTMATRRTATSRSSRAAGRVSATALTRSVILRGSDLDLLSGL